MKREPIIENGVIAGNLYDKYGTKNPVARYLVNGFRTYLDGLVSGTGARDIHEVGCGEGSLCIDWAREGKTVRGSDFSEQVIGVARENASASGVDVRFNACGIYELKPERDAAELIVCCEVLEHLERPEEALEVLARLAHPHLIVSVPREPVWSLMNLARGKYLSSLGNTPGHVQRWSRASFLRLLSSHVHVVKVVTPIPWTMALCRVVGERRTGGCA